MIHNLNRFNLLHTNCYIKKEYNVSVRKTKRIQKKIRRIATMNRMQFQCKCPEISGDNQTEETQSTHPEVMSIWHFLPSFSIVYRCQFTVGTYSLLPLCRTHRQIDWEVSQLNCTSHYTQTLLTHLHIIHYTCTALHSIRRHTSANLNGSNSMSF